MTQEFIVSTLNDENDGDFSQGDLSLREAIALANESEGEDTITFAPDLQGGTISLVKDRPTSRPTLANTPLIITDSVEIVGDNHITIDGDNGGNGIFTLENEDDEIDVSIKGLTITNGAQIAFSFPGLSESGGTFFVGENANLNLQDSIISGSSASIGGAIYNNGTVNIVNSILEENSSGGDGAASNPARRNGIIVNNGELKVSESEIKNNQGSGITNFGSLEVDRSLLENNSSQYAGGAIDNRSIAFVANTVISGNSAGAGSGINNSETGSLSLDRVVIEENTSTSSDNSVILSLGETTIINSTIANHNGGGNVGIVVEAGNTIIESSTIANNEAVQAQAGLIIFPDSEVTLINSTIANNKARSNGGIENFGAIEILNSTIANNTGGLGGGGLRNFGEVNLTSSLLADNNGGANIGDISGDGTFVSGGNNLISNGDDADGFVNGVNGDLVGSNGDDPENPDLESLINANLGELTDNGGGILTIALQEGSRAIDRGSNPNNLEFDQRGEGFDRTSGAATDIGAYELQTNDDNGGNEDNILVVSTLVDENDDDFSEGDLSLREAIALASVSDGKDIITFDASLTGGTISLNESLTRELIISDSIAIEGLGRDNLTLEGGFLFKLPQFETELSIDGLNIVGGKIDSFGNLTVNNSNISQTISLNGGSDNSSIISRGTLNLKNSNVVDSDGGDDLGVLIESGTANIENSTIANHEGVLGGSGLLVLTNETVNVSNSTIANNRNRFAGGIANAGGGEINISNSTIANNVGGLGNGGIQNSSGTVTLTSSLLANNKGGANIGDIAGDGEYISGGNNLISNGDDADGFVNGVNGDIVGTNGDDPQNPDLESLIEANLGNLADSGGGILTIALQEGSRAIDGGSNPNNLEFDQRGEGFDRTSGTATDIGAYELQANGDNGENSVFDRVLLGTVNDDNLSGGDGNDFLNSALGNDSLHGGGGDDVLIGDRGRDNLSGGDGNDILDGGLGRDFLHGDGGDDLLIGGGSGRDVLTGGDGNDVFFLASRSGRKRITDFTDGSDRLQLSEDLTFDDLKIVNNPDRRGVLILDGTDNDAAIVAIDRVSLEEITSHDFIDF